MVKNNKKITSILLLLTLLALSAFLVSASCTYTTGLTNSSTYGGVNTATANTTTFISTQDYTGYTNLTPSANFTHEVNGTLTGKQSGQSVQLLWLTPVNFTSSFTLKNGSTTVGSSNYTLTQSGNNWTINFLTSQFNTSSLTYNFSRTFVKTTDDFLANPSGIYTGAVSTDFVTVSGGAQYGDTASFVLNGASLGGYLNGGSMLMSWGYTQKSCTDNGGCSQAVNLVLFNTLATIFMIAMLVFSVYYLINNPSTVAVVTVVVGYIFMLIGLAIINGLVTGFCTL